MNEPSALGTLMTPAMQASATDLISSNVARAWGAREIDVTRLLEHMRHRSPRDADQEAGVPGFFVIFVRAVCEALSDVPLLNSRWSVEGIMVARGIDIGIEVNTGRGRIVPVVRSADALSVDDLAAALAAAARRAISGETQAGECVGGSFTVGYAGAHGSALSRALLHDGQAGIYHVGVVRRVPCVVADAITVRDMCYASLAFDHRIIDGATSSRFQNLVKSKVESWNFTE